MSKEINILYIQNVGVPGGSFKSLFMIVKNLSDKKKITPYFITVNGPNNIKIIKEGYKYKSVFGLSQFDNCSLSSYHGTRWLLLLREIILIPFSIYAIIYAAKKWKNINVIHVNEITLIGVAVLAKIIIKKPIVLHVRSIQSTQNNLRRKILLNLVNKYSDVVVPIDSNVASTLYGIKNIIVVHNSEVDPNKKVPTTLLKKKVIRFGIVANYLRYKGIEEYVKAAKICINNNKNVDIRFLIYGDSQTKNNGILYYVKKVLGFHYDVKEKILCFIKDNNLGDFIITKGFVSEASEIYKGIDVLVFPSWLNAVGRPVFEAAHYSLPSIVALREKRDDDAVKDGVTGFVIKERNPQELAEAMQKFIDNPCFITEMGFAAQRLAKEQFNIIINSQKILNIYNDLIKQE